MESTTARSILLDFLHYVDQQTKNQFNIPFVDIEDYEDIDYNWTDKECNDVVTYIDDCVIYTDEILNPWCVHQEIYNNGSCLNCHYGSNHGFCNESLAIEENPARYIQILNAINSSTSKTLIDFMNWDVLKNIISKRFI